VSHEDFSDAALILIGHGTTLNEESSAPVYQHAAELRKRKVFAAVREAFWKQEPRLTEVLKQEMGLAEPAPAIPRRIFLAPLFISEGYFSENVVPQALGFQQEKGELVRIQRRGPTTLLYCRPVGTHESMTGVLLARAREVVQRFPFPRAPGPKDISLFIAGHGTEQNENSRAAIERQAEIIRGMNLYAGVHSVFLEEEPRIPACYQLAPTKNILLVPFFVSDGLHVREDIPVLLGEAERIVQARLTAGQPTWRNPTEKHGKLVWYSPSVGTEPTIANVILERVREAARFQL
jgi:sirohydrochlorin cobaltochelatase